MGGILVAEISDREIVVQDWQVEVASLANIRIVAGRNLSVLLHFVLFGVFVGVGGLRLAWVTFHTLAPFNDLFTKRPLDALSFPLKIPLCHKGF